MPLTLMLSEGAVKEIFTTSGPVLGCRVVMTQRPKGRSVRKNRAAQALTRLRNAKLTPEQRQAIARKAARKRWERPPSP